MTRTGMSIGIAALATTLLTFTSGCSSSGTPLARADLSRLAAERQVYLAHQPPRLPLSIFTKETTKAERIGRAFGPIGMVVGGLRSMSSAEQLGVRLANAYGLVDPVATVKERFISAAASHGIATMRSVSEPVPSRNESDLKSRFGESTVLVFKTLTWSVMYGKDERRYQTLYRAEANLVRLQDGAIVWGAECPLQNPGWPDQSALPTLDELTASNGELLRARFAEGATACADHLLGLFFGAQ